MKRFVLIIALLILVIQINVVTASSKDPVEFTDANFKAAIEAKLGVSNPTEGDMLELTGFNIETDMGIKDINGIEYARNIGNFTVTHNQISDISPLSELTNIQLICLNSNNISDISFLVELTNLKWLYLSNNEINDISSLENLTLLISLGISGNNISDLTPLKELTNLETLGIGGNPLVDISVLKELINLKSLNLRSSHIDDISSLAQLTNLQSLDLFDTQIRDLSNLSGLVNLQELYLDENQLVDITPLEELINLQILWISRNNISDISVLKNLTNLQRLELFKNKINDISSLEGLTNLENLSLYNNEIDNIIPLSGLNNLVSLNLSANKIENITPISGLKNLTSLNLNQNKISDISAIKELVHLTELNLFSNLISDISPLTELNELTFLNLSSNPLNFQAYDIHIPKIQQDNPTLERDVNFFYDDLVEYTLTITSMDGGSVIMPGEGLVEVSRNTVMTIEAAPSDSYSMFIRWTGTAVDSGKVDDPNNSKTTILVDSDYTLNAIFEPRPEGPAPGFSLGEIITDDPQEMYYRIASNNTEENTFIERVTGLEPDPNGMIRMQLGSEDSNQPLMFFNSEPTVTHDSARMKGSFGKFFTDQVFVRFQYLFETNDRLEIIVYLSDVSDLLAREDPDRDKHYREIGRIQSPPEGRPGSFGSERFGSFEALVSKGSFKFNKGLWVELELVSHEPQEYLNSSFNIFTSYIAGGSVLIDNWASEVHCDGICMDLNNSNGPTMEDFMMVLSLCGGSTGMLEGSLDNMMCMDGIFGFDGYIDSYDLTAWDWVLNDISNHNRLNLCGMPYVPENLNMSLMNMAYSWLSGSSEIIFPVNLMNYANDFIVIGKNDINKDSIYYFDNTGQNIGWSEPTFNSCNIRLVQDTEGNLYQINSDSGIIKLDGTGDVIVPPGQTSIESDPRYQVEAEIYIGVQNVEDSPFGHPVLDAAFDANYIYVVPVVVKPDGEESYLAAAKLELSEKENPPYNVVQLYDDPPVFNDNRYSDNLREIELDGDGNIYVINANVINESDTLWKYSSDGTILNRVGLGNTDSNDYIPDPLSMYISDFNDMLYIVSGQNIEDSNSTTVYGFSKTVMTLERTIRINNMRHVTGITENPATGELWVVGFNIDSVNMNTGVIYYSPQHATIPLYTDTVESITFEGDYDLKLPMSIIWTGDMK